MNLDISTFLQTPGPAGVECIDLERYLRHLIASGDTSERFIGALELMAVRTAVRIQDPSARAQLEIITNGAKPIRLSGKIDVGYLLSEINGWDWLMGLHQIDLSFELDLLTGETRRVLIEDDEIKTAISECSLPLGHNELPGVIERAIAQLAQGREAAGAASWRSDLDDLRQRLIAHLCKVYFASMANNPKARRSLRRDMLKCSVPRYTVPERWLSEEVRTAGAITPQVRDTLLARGVVLDADALWAG